MISSRRAFITGLVSLVAAPAIVRAGSLMPVKVIDHAALRHAMIDFAERLASPPILLDEHGGFIVPIEHLKSVRSVLIVPPWVMQHIEDAAR